MVVRLQSIDPVKRQPRQAASDDNVAVGEENAARAVASFESALQKDGVDAERH